MMAQTILGIDIGTYSIKLSHLTRRGGEVELMNFFEKNLSRSARLSHEEAVGAALRNIVENNEIEADTVVASLPSNLLSCRVVELPFGNVKKIDQTVEFELESYIPVSIDDLIIDYHILHIEAKKSLILVAYVPRSRFIKYLNVFEMAGLDPKYIGIDSVDISHIAQMTMVPEDSVYIILDIGHSKTNLCVMKGSRLQYVRSITVGGAHFTKVIQKAFHVNFEKAEALKIERGKLSLQDDDLDQIGRLCRKVFEELVVAIRQTYLGYKKIYPNDEWIALYLTGGAARMPGLSDALSQSLNLNVSSIDSLEFIKHHIDHPELSRDTMALSLGQALRVIHSNKAVKINFRKDEFAFKQDLQLLGGEIKQVGLWFVIVIILGLLHFGYSYHTLTTRVEENNSNLVKMAIKAVPELEEHKKKSPKKIMTILKSRIAEISPQLEAMQSSSSKVTPLNALLEISKALPPKKDLKLDVNDYHFLGAQVKIKGKTTSYKDVETIKNALSASKFFADVSTGQINSRSDGINFELTLNVADASDS